MEGSAAHDVRGDATAGAALLEVDPLAEATRLRCGLLAQDASHTALINDSSTSSSSSSTSGLDSSDASSEGSSDGELETPADRAGPSIRGVLSAHWTRVPLGRQIAACNRRWQLELPLRGAVSLATQHHLQSSTSSDDIDSTREAQEASMGWFRQAGGGSSAVPVAAMTEQEREDRLVKMMAAQLGFPPSSAAWTNGGNVGGDGTSEASGRASATASTSSNEAGTSKSPGFSFSSSSPSGWTFQSSPQAQVQQQNQPQVFKFSAGIAGASTGAQGVDAASSGGVEGSDGRGGGDSRPDIPAVPFVFRAGGRSKT